MKPPLISGLLIFSFLAAAAGSPQDVYTHTQGALTISTSLWFTCVKTNSGATEVCSEDFSLCDTFFARIEAARAFAVLASLACGVAAIIATMRITLVGMREKKWQKVLLFFMGLSMIFALIEFPIAFSLFTEGFCGKASQRDIHSSLGANPFLFALCFLLLGITAVVEVKLAMDVRFTEPAQVFLRNGASGRRGTGGDSDDEQSSDNNSGDNDYDIYQSRYTEAPVDFRYVAKQEDEEGDDEDENHQQHAATGRNGGTRGEQQVVVEKKEEGTWGDL